MDNLPLRNMGFELARVTEATALSAARWVGLGTREKADESAFKTMSESLNYLDMDGKIVFGEAFRLGKTPELGTGVLVGRGNGPRMDVLANPIDGASYVIKTMHNAMSAVAVAPRDTIWSPVPAVYLNKIVVDHDVAEALVTECLAPF